MSLPPFSSAPLLFDRQKGPGWLGAGEGECAFLSSPVHARRLQDLDNLSEFPILRTSADEVLVICGDSDTLLPSRDEGQRLMELIPNSRLRYVETAGHLGWSDQRLDLAAELRQSWIA